MRYRVAGVINLVECKVPFEATFDLDTDSVGDMIEEYDDIGLGYVDALENYIMDCYGPFAIELTEAEEVG